MTITFENDNDVIVYALEKIISIARNTQQILVAQCVWWLASIIGLEQGLVNHIDNLRKRKMVAASGNHSGNVYLDQTKQNEAERAISPTPRDREEDPRKDTNWNFIHPDRQQQVDNPNCDINDLDLNESEQVLIPEAELEVDRQDQVVKETKQFLNQSRKERRKINKQRAKDQLSQLRSGKVLKHHLTQGQRKYLQCIPKDTIADYLENWK